MELQDLKQFELNRFVSLLRANGYSVVTSAFENQNVVVTLEKVIPGSDQTLKNIEAQRVALMVGSLGWSQTRVDYVENKIVTTFLKEVKGEV